MELRYFLSVLSKRKWLLLVLAFSAAVATALVIGFLPKKYKSSAQIATGLIDYKTLRVGEANPFVQEFEIESKFANLVEYMKSRPAINALTKKLMLHDLRAQEGEPPFRKLELDSKSGVSQDQINRYLSALESNVDSVGISDDDRENIWVARTLEKALGYDYETIREKIEIKRVDKTEYVRVDYVSEKPELTYFVTKTFVDEFLKFYYARRDTNENKSLAFYRQLVADKKRVLDSLNDAQINFAKANNLVAPVDQSQAIVAQIKELETTRDEAVKNKAGFEKSMKVYENEVVGWKKFIKNDYAENVATNNEIRRIDEELKSSYEKLVDNGSKDDGLRKRIDDLKSRKVLVSQRIALARRDQSDPVITRQEDMFVRAVDAKSNFDAASQHVDALNGRIRQLYGKQLDLVKDNAEWNRFSAQIKIAQAEYEYAIDKQYQASVIKDSGEKEEPVRVIEEPMFPYKPESSKRALLSAFAGVGSMTLGTMVLFMLAYFDKSLTSVFQFRKQVGLTLLGSLNKLSNKQVPNLDYVFGDGIEDKNLDYFKESLRKIRHDLEASGAKSFLIVSPKAQEGKSFLTAALAYSLSLKNKKVLIIDTNFKNNTLTSLSANPANSAQVLPSTTRLDIAVNLPSVNIIGNKGGNNSPSELMAGIDFKKRIDEFGAMYDYIFLEAAAMNKFSDARELVDVVEKVIPIFDSTTTITLADDNSLQFLKSLDNKVLGCVLNKVDLKNLV